MEEELRRVKKLESLGVLAGGIAHDFNNILTVLMGNISLVRRLVGEDDPIHVMMTDAEKATLRARRLTHQLLTFAKGGEPVKETANIAEVVRESAEFILQGTAAACCYDLPNDLWLVDIDRGQIGQVVQNIVLNASQAMPGGGGITISGRTIELPDNSPLPLKAGRYVRITVRDTGIGIPDLQLEKIFDPYFTTKQQGSGLGLAITQSIIRKHSGHVEASSVLGEGTAFSVFLPASRTDVTDLTPPPTDQAAAHEGRILVMDDEAVVRKTSVAMLNHLGYEAEEASDGGDVLRRVQAAAAAGAPFDAVIMDLTVPGGIGGVETVRHLRQAGVTARLVASSGYCNDPVMAAFHEYGFDGAVPKPYVVEEMADALRRVLRGKK
jgi:CheY-like chemotaxis protein/anti-sigma regulatory factor (Ser/Thr protein kinase)